MNVLVLCTGNSARSILLEVLLRDKSAGKIQSYSAGSNPTGRPHREALALLKRNGHPTEGLRSKSWDEFSQLGAPRMGLVITVCDNAANEVCPIWPGTPAKAHWGIADPAIDASEAEVSRAFKLAYLQLSYCVNAMLSAPVDIEDALVLGRVAAGIKPPSVQEVSV